MKRRGAISRVYLPLSLQAKKLPQCLTLAVPGVIFGCVAMAAFVKLALGYGWNWHLSLTLGSILAATDPVAVVALLNSLGASPSLTMLVTGESLLNDGTAMVLLTPQQPSNTQPSIDSIRSGSRASASARESEWRDTRIRRAPRARAAAASFPCSSRSLRGGVRRLASSCGERHHTVGVRPVRPGRRDGASLRDALESRRIEGFFSFARRRRDEASRRRATPRTHR